MPDKYAARAHQGVNHITMLLRSCRLGRLHVHDTHQSHHLQPSICAAPRPGRPAPFAHDRGLAHRRRPPCCRAIEEAAPPPSLQGELRPTDGTPAPLGPSPIPGGVNFALAAPAASQVTLCLFCPDGSPMQEVPTHPSIHPQFTPWFHQIAVENKSSNGVWHVALQGLPQSGVLYGYKVDGKGGWDTSYRWDGDTVLLDPYAPLTKGRARYGMRDEFEQFRLKVCVGQQQPMQHL